MLFLIWADQNYNTQKNPSVVFATAKNPGVFHRPKKIPFGQNVRPKKVLRTPPVIKICEWGPWEYMIYRASNQGAKKVIFTACHSGKLKLTFTSPNVISTSPKNVLISRLISQFFCNLNSSKNFTCLSGKLRTEFTSPIANPLTPGYRTLLSLHTVVTPFQHPLKLECKMS